MYEYLHALALLWGTHSLPSNPTNLKLTSTEVNDPHSTQCHIRNTRGNNWCGRGRLSWVGLAVCYCYCLGVWAENGVGFIMLDSKMHVRVCTCSSLDTQKQVGGWWDLEPPASVLNLHVKFRHLPLCIGWESAVAHMSCSYFDQCWPLCS